MYVKLDPMRLARAARARARERAGTAARDEAGFTVTESVTAMFILMVVSLALVSSVTMAIRGVLTGRQRTTALSVAEELMEEVRAVKYDRVGHDLSDPTLTQAESDFWFDGTNYRYDPDGVAGEALALAKEDAVVGGPSGAIDGHWTSGSDDSTPWEAWVYITHVDTSVAGGDAHKRVTVEVLFDHEQFDVEEDESIDGGEETVENRAKISSLVFPADAAPADLVSAKAESDAGMATITGTLNGSGLQSLTTTYPHTYAELRSHQFRELNGWSHSAHAQLVDDDGVTAMGECTASGNTATCPMAAPLSLAVSDDATIGLPRYDVATDSGAVGTLGSGVYQVAWNGGTVDGELSTCYGAGADCGGVFGAGGAADGLPYQVHEGDGPDGLGIPFTLDLPGVLPDLDGDLVSFSGANHSESEIDTDATGSGQTDKTTPTANTTAPSIDIVSLGDPLGLLGDVTLVSISSVDVTATSPVGPTAAGPTVTAAPVTVSVAGVSLPSVDPGMGDIEEAAGTIDLFSILAVDYDVDVTTGTEDTWSDDPGNVGFITESHARVTDVMRIVVRVEIVACPDSSTDLSCLNVPPTTVADVTLELDYGDLETEAVLALP